MEIYKKLEKIQKELKAPKGQYNNFGKYKYRSCEDIVEAVKPLLDGAVLLLSDEIVQIGERYYVEASATFSDGKESITIKAQAREAEHKKGMDESQVTGAASSYARKYALNGLFAIDDTKDADTQKPENGGNGENQNKAEAEDKEQLFKQIVAKVMEIAEDDVDKAKAELKKVTAEGDYPGTTSTATLKGFSAYRLKQIWNKLQEDTNG